MKNFKGTKEEVQNAYSFNRNLSRVEGTFYLTVLHFFSNLLKELID